MKIITKYVADDGREFDSKDACVVYEYKTNHLPRSISWWGEDSTYLTPSTHADVLKARSDVYEVEVAGTNTWKDDCIEMGYIFGFDEYATDITEPGTYLVIGGHLYKKGN